MDRLTKRDRHGNPMPKELRGMGYGQWHEMVDVFERLAEYEDEEEQGRLLHLPCRIGDKIYYVQATPCERGMIGGCPYPGINCEECRFILHIIEEFPFRLSCLDAEGRLRKGFFVNRDEAEAYLKELED